MGARFTWFLANHRILWKAFLFLNTVIGLPCRLLTLRKFLRERRRKSQEFKVGDMVRLRKNEQKFKFFASPQAQESILPRNLGKKVEGDFQEVKDSKPVPTSVVDLFFEQRVPFKIVKIESNPIAIIWPYLKGHEITHPQWVDMENRAVGIGECRTGLLPADLLEKMEPQ
ncbi:MAG: hypothetical protein Q7S34_02600 [bacterium]|nr:hypothetical protein [bacterium]